MNFKRAIPLCALLGIAGGIIMGLRSQTLPRLGFVATSQIEMFNHKTGELVTTKALQEIVHSDGTSSRVMYTDSMQETIDPNSRMVTLVDFLSKTYMTQPFGRSSGIPPQVSHSCLL